MTRLNIIAFACFVSLAIGSAGGYVFAQSGQHGSQHAHSQVTPGTVPEQQGQSAFAAIAEIVAILATDPATDWAKVDITALREHLVDMSALTLNATVSAIPLKNGMEFTVAGDRNTIDALQNMVPAHAAELDKMNEWSATGTATSTGAVLTVTSTLPTTAAKIKGLGFFGLMATGAHHQPHHLAIATGSPMH